MNVTQKLVIAIGALIIISGILLKVINDRIKNHTVIEVKTK